MHKENENLLKALADCANACNHCYNECFKEDDLKKMVPCIRLDRDCADICLKAMGMVASGSPMKREILDLCAKACKACGDECAKHDTAHCRECAEACRRCEEACRAAA